MALLSVVALCIAVSSLFFPATIAASLGPMSAFSCRSRAVLLHRTELN